jgi:FMN-dependent NADH-azoreductase
MAKLVHIQASPRKSRSASQAVAARFIDGQQYGSILNINVRNLLCSGYNS